MEFYFIPINLDLFQTKQNVFQMVGGKIPKLCNVGQVIGFFVVSNFVRVKTLMC